ncbi:pilus assembly PilX family protein [Diaphorobacter sp.]|uniref:pilus assembly PilX family protein n=1 Tax=Diaphorobacter sp. TaxID=1934310 RepID=UPI003D09B720
MQRMPPDYHRRQQGVALFVVIVFVMLSMLLALWASRTSLFNELVVGNDADYQRAFEAAQALIQDAELDIRGERADGSSCVGTGDVCRAGIAVRFPPEAKDVGPLLANLDPQPTQCSKGLCVKRTGKLDFWNNNDTTQGVTLEEMTKTGARYGQFTGAAVGNEDNPANPILADTGAFNRGGWYWIEVLPYDESSKNSNLIVGGPSNLLPLHLTPSVVYRITAVAFGRKTRPPRTGETGAQPVTVVVLQQTYARQRAKD